MTLKFKKGDQLIDSGLCEPNLNLLAHAQCIEVEIGSRCGGHGICGGDRILIPKNQAEFFSKITPEETRHLSAEDLARGIRLACQCFPEKPDLNIEINILSPSH